MTYKPIPEHRRRELAALIPELTRKFKSWLGASATGESERDFWQRLAPGVGHSVAPDELVWLIRQARSAAGCIDPVSITDYTWPGRCKLTGPKATRERWPLEPIPDEPQAQPTPEGPLVDGTPVKEGDVLYYVGDYKPFVGARVVAAKPKRTTPHAEVYNEGFHCLDGRWIQPGHMACEKLSRTKPVIIEGRVVKPGDVLYYLPSTPNPRIVGQKRTVSAVISAGTLEFTNGSRGSPENLTYVALTALARTTDKSPALAAPFGAGLTATQRMEIERNRFLRVCLDDADYMSRFMNRIPGAKLEGAIHDDLNFSAPQFTNLMLDLETMRPGRIVFDPAILSTSITKEKPTMDQTAQQATPFNHASLHVDTSKIVEVKTFVYGTDIATLNDDDLLSHVERLTAAIEHLELLNTRTPLVKVVAKIAQLKDAKAKIVDLLGGAPVPAASDLADSIVATRSYGDANAQPRKRRTKAEMEADAQQGGATPSKPVPPAPPAPTQPEPSVADVDLDD